MRLMRSGFVGPVNIGSEEMVTIDQLADLIIGISGKEIDKRYVAGPQGVRGRNSDNRLIKEKLQWAPSQPLLAGLKTTYFWIERQLHSNKAATAPSSLDSAKPKVFLSAGELTVAL